MAIVRRTYGPRRQPELILVACPLCGYHFSPEQSRPKHFVEEHGPGDCEGVTPLGERPPDADRPLFEDTDTADPAGAD
jgi:hypothetical protein